MPRKDKETGEEKQVVRELYRATVDVPLYATEKDAINAYLGKLEQAWKGAFKNLTTASGTKEGFYKGLGSYGTHSNYGDADKKKPAHPLDPVLDDTKKLLTQYADEQITMAKLGIKTVDEAKPPDHYDEAAKEGYRRAMGAVRESFENEIKFFTQLKETIEKMK